MNLGPWLVWNPTRQTVPQGSFYVNSRLRDAKRRQEFGALPGVLDLSDFRLGLGAEGTDFTARTGELGFRLLDELRVREIGFSAIQCGDDALDCEKLQRAHPLFFAFVPRIFAE